MTDEILVTEGDAAPGLMPDPAESFSSFLWTSGVMGTCEEVLRGAGEEHMRHEDGGATRGGFWTERGVYWQMPLDVAGELLGALGALYQVAQVFDEHHDGSGGWTPGDVQRWCAHLRQVMTAAGAEVDHHGNVVTQPGHAVSPRDLPEWVPARVRADYEQWAGSPDWDGEF